MFAPEETLDPTDWQATRSLGHRMIDDMMDYLSTLRSRPAWQPLPAAARADIRTPLPLGPTPEAEVYDRFRSTILPYPNGNTHPRFWGWVQGTGTPLAMLADMLASGMNPHLAGFDHAAPVVEETVVDWMKTLFRFPGESTGLLTSGATMANLIGLTVARNAMAGFNIRAKGLQGLGDRRLVAFASTEVHSWAPKAMETLGLGREALHVVPVDDHYRIDVALLRQRIAASREAGEVPFCVIATAGTVNTGAIDDLEALADLCQAEGLWLHVAGAFGALAALSPAHASLVAGLERADSLAFDLHKWMYLPFEIGCALIGRPGAQKAAFAQEAPYLEASGRGVAPGPLSFADLGIELSRGFKALKAWMCLQAYGVDTIGRLIGQNITQAGYLADRIGETPHLRLMAAVSLNVVCFRFESPGLAESALDALNREIMVRLQESGVAVPSGTRLQGRFVLRVAIVNHRSTRADFEVFVAETERIGQQVLAEVGQPLREAVAR